MQIQVQRKTYDQPRPLAWRFKKITDPQDIIRLHSAGLGDSYIAHLLGLTQVTVWRWRIKLDLERNNPQGRQKGLYKDEDDDNYRERLLTAWAIALEELKRRYPCMSPEVMKVYGAIFREVRRRELNKDFRLTDQEKLKITYENSEVERLENKKRELKLTWEEKKKLDTARSLRYYWAHREERRKYNKRLWRRNHPERKLTLKEKFSDPELVERRKQMQKEYREKNRDVLNAKKRAKRKDFPELCRAKEKEYRMKKKEVVK